MYYSVDNDLIYWNSIQELMEELQLDQTSGQWRVLIDSTKVGLKAVLLHGGNKYPCVPLAYAVHMKEVCENLQVLLQKMYCEEHRWNICADLKDVTVLTVLQGRYTKFCCFSCEWDSGARDCHYRIRNGHSGQKQHQVRIMWHVLLQGLGKKSIRQHCMSSSAW